MTLRGKTPKRKRFSPATVATVTDWRSAITLIFLFESVGSTCMLRYYISLGKAFSWSMSGGGGGGGVKQNVVAFDISLLLTLNSSKHDLLFCTIAFLSSWKFF